MSRAADDGGRPEAIEDYAIVGDLQTAALISRRGSVDWLCLPDFDSPACFATLLDRARSGRWLLDVADGVVTRRAYRPDSLVLETDWHCATGSARVIDFMPPGKEASHLVRVVTVLHGEVCVRLRLRPRFEYGSVTPSWKQVGDRIVALAGDDALWLDSPLELRPQHGELRADVPVTAGMRLAFVLANQNGDEPSRIDADESLRATDAYWRRWISESTYDGPWASQIHRSEILVKAMTHARTGGIVASPTTSLPESLGGERNWDYRYCWLRDSTLTLQALTGTGHHTEARQWHAWLLRALGGHPENLRIVYRLDGGRELPERELPWLQGYRASRPVRIGNGAAGQRQLDVVGEVMRSLAHADDAGIDIPPASLNLQLGLAYWLERTWREPGQGIWEMRGPPRQFTYPKALAWGGMDAAIRTAQRHRAAAPLARWRTVRDEIHAQVCAQGFDQEANTFTQFYGSDSVDASLLLLGRVGFLPWSDPRIMGTVEAVRHRLDENGLLLRYRPAHELEGVGGREGAFLACGFWLVDALHGTGRQDQAVDLFERLLRLRNEVGLLSEECDPATGAHLGNTPIAFSLVGLINSGLRLSGRHQPDPGGTT